MDYVLIHVALQFGGSRALISGHCNGILTPWWGATASQVLQNDAGGEGGGVSLPSVTMVVASRPASSGLETRP